MDGVRKVKSEEVRVDMDAEKRLVDIDLDVGGLLPDKGVSEEVRVRVGGPPTLMEGQ